MNPLIRCEALGKQYRRGVRYDEGLRHVLTRFVKSPFRSLFPPRPETFWAVREVSFEVKRGEVLGLIGKNGAGKSTLLKILSRITRPTEGWAEIYGRIGSLLEVGTGFHGELTGRENTYMSGSILGMRKREIDNKFDEIIAFAELEKFVDTPVKHYSSGMYVRLAFSVAAHLEAEVLLVDEVLAVGDINFQKKCLGKMEDISRRGRTILLVSHNMTAIGALCSRCILMDQGRITADGATSTVAAKYYTQAFNIGATSHDLATRSRRGSGGTVFRSIAIRAQKAGEDIEFAIPGCDLRVEIGLECQLDCHGCNLAIIFFDSNGYRVIDVNTAQQGEFLSLRKGQTATALFFLRDVLLRPGTYFIGLWFGRHGIGALDEIDHAATIEVGESEDTTRHSVSYPGLYLCRFERQINIR